MNNTKNINQERFNKHVAPIFDILKEMDVRFWLDFGTLLGAIRDKVIFDWDHDFDISVHDSDRKKLILAKDLLETKGYKVVLQKNIHWFEDLMQIYIPRDQISTDSKGRIMEGFDHVDIYIYTLIEDSFCMRRVHEPVNSGFLGINYYMLYRMINRSELKYSDNKVSLRNKPIMFIISILPKWLRGSLSDTFWEFYIDSSKSAWLVTPYNFFTEFTSITLYGYELEVPEKYEEYLEYRYSANWRVPDANWDVKNNGGCIHKKIKNSNISHISVETKSNFDRYLWE
jgi:phosphorylcholine metabolism protein LicD